MQSFIVHVDILCAKQCLQVLPVHPSGESCDPYRNMKYRKLARCMRYLRETHQGIAVHTDKLHLPKTPWRRVILDEIQDLVCSGTD